MTAGGRTCARVSSSPLHQPVGSTGLQTGKLRFRVYISWPRSQQELGFQPLQCKQSICRGHHFAGDWGPTLLCISNHAPFLDTFCLSYLWAGVLLWISELLETQGGGREMT